MTQDEWLVVGQVGTMIVTAIAVVVALILGKKDRESANDRAAEDRRIADKRAEEDRRATDARAQAARDEADARAEEDRVAARALREEQAQPYVVVSLAQADAQSPYLMFLVIRNYGSTAAQDVKITMTPPPTLRAGPDDVRDLPLPPLIPTLVPGQEWRTVWRTGFDDPGGELPTRFDATAEYTDSRGELLSTPSVLDFGVFPGQMYVTRHGLHDLAETLRKINKRDEARFRWERSDRNPRTRLDEAAGNGEQDEPEHDVGGGSSMAAGDEL